MDTDAATEVAPPGVAPSERKRLIRADRGWWWKGLILGVALWAVTAGVTALTRNTNLVPTLILLGSFLVPFCVVLFAAERRGGSVGTQRLWTAFFIGGLLGVLGASLLEANLSAGVWTYVPVGFIEEAVKGVLLVIVGWHVVPKTAAVGGLIGATIGAGFAAFESTGYALRAALTPGGIDLISLLQSEALRAVLAPLGHVLWTAVLGAVIFGAARGSARFHWSWWIPVAFVGVSVLHALWDSASELAVLLAIALTGATPTELQRGFPTAQMANTFAAVGMALSVVLLAAVSLIGIIALVFAERLGRSRTRRLSAYR